MTWWDLLSQLINLVAAVYIGWLARARWDRKKRAKAVGLLEIPSWAQPGDTLRVEVHYSDERQIPPWYNEELGDTKIKEPEGETP